MELLNQLANLTTPLKWSLEEKASEADMHAFWKHLRHFYRTGEKPENDDSSEMTSAFLPLLNQLPSSYPFKINKNLHLEYGPLLPFQLLNHQLNHHQEEKRRKFKSQLDQLIKGLNDLLEIDDPSTETKNLENTFDFADELIAFDKMVDLLPKKKTVELSEERTDRLKKTLNELQKGLKEYEQSNATILLDSTLKEKCLENELFTEVSLIESESDPFLQALSIVRKQMADFTILMKNFRVASLEIEDEYNTEIHDDYFDHFTWHRLKIDEIHLFHPLVVIADHALVFDLLASYSKLLASNIPVNLLVLNHQAVTRPNEDLSWEDASHQFRQELSTITIAQRNTFFHQSGLDDPQYLMDGLLKCLDHTNPAVCHVSNLIEQEQTLIDSTVISNGLTNSRYFPKLNYNPDSKLSWHDRFDLTRNKDVQAQWPNYIIQAETNDNTTVEMDTAFTYADYKALFSNKVEELMVIPASFYNEHLVPLHEYLNLEESLLYGKIPYIWLIDVQGNLQRAAVPNVWVVSCQERLDNWKLLQEMSGITAVSDEENDSLSSGKGSDNGVLPSDSLEKIKSEALAQAAEQLIAALLEDEDGTLTPSNSSSEMATVSFEDKSVQTPQEEEVGSSNELAWIESENCTSCNECTDKYPGIFQYNDEKQAYIKDPTKGTYADLVKAAEKCPAECIHPGMPFNKNESNLEALIKRAEKFN